MSNDFDEQRDDLVARALGSLPTPDHTPGFWDRLEGAFDQVDHENAPEAAVAGAGTPLPPATGAAEVHDLDTARQSPRRQGHLGRRYRMLSAAAAVAVIIGGVAVINSNSNRNSGGQQEAPAAARLGDPEAEAQFDAVRAWSQALADEDVEAGWAVIGPLTRQQFGGKAGLAQFYASRNEGGGPTPVYRPDKNWASYPIAGEPEGAVVVAPPAGGAEGAVFPVVRAGSGWVLELGVTGGSAAPQLVSRSARQPGEPADIPIEVSYDEAGVLYGRVDGKGDFVQFENVGNGLFRFDRGLYDLPNGTRYLETVQRGPSWFYVSSVSFDGATGAGDPMESAPTEVVRLWSKAVDERRADDAWELMGPDSRAYLEAQGGWEDMVLEMQEGSHAGWHRTDDAQWLFQPLLGRPDAGVVTVAAQIELEGTPEYRVDAYPMVKLDGRWKVEPFAFGPGDTDAEWVSPAPGPSGLGGIGPDGTVRIDARPGAEVFISVDGGPTTPMDKVGERRWEHRPAEPFSNGTHVAVVLTRAAGYFTASPGQFTVEG